MLWCSRITGAALVPKWGVYSLLESVMPGPVGALNPVAAGLVSTGITYDAHENTTELANQSIGYDVSDRHTRTALTYGTVLTPRDVQHRSRCTLPPAGQTSGTPAPCLSRSTPPALSALYAPSARKADLQRDGLGPRQRRLSAPMPCHLGTLSGTNAGPVAKRPGVVILRALSAQRRAHPSYTLHCEEPNQLGRKTRDVFWILLRSGSRYPQKDELH
ncbi:hypothetical protein JF66_19380 [Cryobacterium sp. MLB-32]|nr:hypothetical protein JF66_19380 [Cryobacterium sp. MLB-32]